MKTILFVCSMGFAMPVYAQQLETTVSATVDNAAYYAGNEIGTAYENTWHQDGDF